MAAKILRPLWVLVFAIAIGLLHVGVPAKAQHRELLPIICDDREKLERWLEGTHSEQVRATGRQDNTDFPVQLWLSPSGSFTVTILVNDTTLCAALSGNAFRLGSVSSVSGDDT